METCYGIAISRGARWFIAWVSGGSLDISEKGKLITQLSKKKTLNKQSMKVF